LIFQNLKSALMKSQIALE